MLTTQLNQRLQERADGIHTLHFFHDRLHWYLGADGVHLNNEGNRRLLLFSSLYSAGRRAVPNGVNTVVYCDTLHSSGN